MIESEAVREGLLIGGRRLLRRVGLSRVATGLRTRHVLGAHQGQHVSQLGRVDKVRRPEDHQAAASLIEHLNTPHDVSVDVGPNRVVFAQEAHPTAAEKRCQETFQYRQGDPRLVTEARDMPTPRIQIPAPARRTRQRIMPPIEIALALAKVAVATRGAEALDPRMLVGRHPLGSQLAADSVALLCENNL